ncbi:MAG TPA: CoA transferase [Gaiellaceae bacterium]|nr:CoA transferase [Gaiellaceae bacterium]
MISPVVSPLLTGIRIVSTAINVPGPAAAARLVELGASVTKVEPPGGDPLEAASPELYTQLAAGQDVVRLDLKDDAGRARLDELLAAADALLTSSRPSALSRLGLGREQLEARHPQLAHVAIVGHPAPDQERPGHDLTYVAEHGLVTPPQLPQALVADLGGAERAATALVALLLGRARGGAQRDAEVALADAAAFFSLPHEHGLTRRGGHLGGGSPFYGLYGADGGWIALAALEPRFRERLEAELGGAPEQDSFAARTPAEWEAWAAERDLPLAAVAG